jgi:hypothetical protein
MGLVAYTRDGRPKELSPVWAPQGVVASAYLSANSGTITAGTPTKITLNAEDFDPYNWFNTSTGRFQPSIPGYYRVSAAVEFNIHASAGNSLALIYKNGSLFKEIGRQMLNTTFGTTASGGCLVYLNGSTDYVELWASPGQSVVAIATNTHMQIDLVASSVGVAPEPWHLVGAAGEPAFANSWANNGGGQPVASFFRDPHGIVHLKGLVKNGTVAVAAFTLPAGYRPDPLAAERWALPFFNSSASSYGVAYAQVSANGDVVPINNALAGTWAANNGWVDLAAVSFKAEA